MVLVSLLILLAQRSVSSLEPQRAATARTVLEGQVLTSEGLPASGAVVVSDMGGRAVAGEDGWFRLELELPAERSELRVTAVLGSGPSGSMAATSVPVPPSGGRLPVGAVRLKRGGACQPEWLPTFGTAAGTDDSVESLAVLDDGSGPALFVGGSFTRAGSVLGNGIAKWDGARWSQLGDGFADLDEIFTASVQALAMFDAGAGPQLYAGGDLYFGGVLNGVARWNGTSWEGIGLDDTVRALAVFDDGTGPALYAGGHFHDAGFGDFVAKWDGTTWSGVGGGMDFTVQALTVFDDGSGPAVYAGGSFDTAGGVTVNRIARWDGTSWSALGSGTTLGSVSALTVFDDGSGPALYAGGSFRIAGGMAANRIAKWDGATWSPLGSGMNSSVSALTAFDDGGGPALFAAGGFTSAGGSPASYVARWDGSAWGAVGSGTNRAAATLAGFDAGSGSRLYLGGRFELADGKDVSNLASWDGIDWAPIGGSPFGHDASTRISDLAVFDDGGGNGPALYAAGFFTGAVWGANVARWDGSAWALLGTVADEPINALAVFDDGGGPALYAGGEFSSIGGVPAENIARWDGSSWAPLGFGVESQVLALAVFDDGGGEALYVGGSFATAGGLAAAHIARWNGASWSPLAGGTLFGVIDLAVFDDGGGDALYAGGGSTAPGGNPLGRIARWDGGAWSALGAGIGESDSYLLALEVFDDGSGAALYAGGRFSTAGGATVSNLARWDGAAWSDVGGGVSGFAEPWVEDLQVFDDGGGPALYAGGIFASAGGVPAAHIARWDGASWSPLGSGVSTPPPFSFTSVLPSPVRTLAVHTGSTGNLALYAGGIFYAAPDSGDSYLARWQGCFDVTAPTIHQPPDLVVREVPGSPPGEVVTFTVTATDNKDASTSVTCTPPSGSSFPPGVTLVTCQATDASGHVASSSFRVIVTSKVR